MRKFPLTLSVFIFLLLPLTVFGAWGRPNKDFKQPTPAELSMTSATFAPGASAVMLDWIARHDDDESYASEHIRIKVLSAEGKKYGDIELMYIPGFTSLSDIKARVIQPDGKVVPFTGKMYDKLVIKAGGYKLMQKTFSLPDVQAGSIIEYRFERTWPVTSLMPTSWVLQRELPIAKMQVWVKPYSGPYTSFFISKGLKKEEAPKLIGDHYELELANIPAFEDEPYSPSDKELKPRVTFYYTEGKPDVDKYWNDIGKNWTDAIERFIGDRSGIKKVAMDVTKDAVSNDDRLRRLYARVQQLRNLSYEEDKTVQETRREKLKDSRHVEHVLNAGYGYRNELNRLFVALARGAGFPASIVCVSQRNEMFFAKQMLDYDQIDGEVALVTVDGEDKFLDPGTPHAPFGLLPWENTTSAALKLQKKKPAEWITTPDQPSTLAQTRRRANLELDGDVLKGKVRVTWQGQEALRRRLAAHTHDEAANRKTLLDEVKGWFPDGSTVTLPVMPNLASSDDTLVGEFDVEVANLGTSAGSRTLVPLAVFSATRKNPFSAEQRLHPVYFRYPHQYEDEVTLKLPEGMAVEGVPQAQNLDLGGAGVVTSWNQADGAVTLKRKMYVKSILIPQNNYHAIRNFYSKVASVDQESLVLKKAAK
ncbi:MAG TPA: DUF3857 and transglutaminase domain-containing protein [Thermoanaerobaculia bacterium]|jgi:hypothetical protein